MNGLWKNQRGMSMVMVTMLLATILVFAGMFTMVQSQKAGTKAMTVNLSLQTVSRNIISTLENDHAWLYTLAANGLNCLATDGATCGAFPPKVHVRDAGNGALVSTAANSGFDLYGKPCATFDPTGATKTDCVYHVDVTLACEPTPCVATKISPGQVVATEPNLRLRSTLVYSPYAPDDPNLRKRMDAQYYTFNFVRANRQETISKTCLIFGGYFDQESQKCRLARTSQPCAANQYLLRIGADGLPQCAPAPMFAGYCTQGTGVTGLSITGHFVCWLF